MSILELGALGEFLGLFALVATLIYVAIQMRHSKKQSERAVMQARSSGAREVLIALATSDELSAAFCRANDILGRVPYGNFDAELTSRGVDPQDAMRLELWWTARFLADFTEFEGLRDKPKRARQEIAAGSSQRIEESVSDRRAVGTYGAGLGRLFWDVGPRTWGVGLFSDHINRLLAEADKQA